MAPQLHKLSDSTNRNTQLSFVKGHCFRLNIFWQWKWVHTTIANHKSSYRSSNFFHLRATNPSSPLLNGRERTNAGAVRRFSLAVGRTVSLKQRSRFTRSPDSPPDSNPPWRVFFSPSSLIPLQCHHANPCGSKGQRKRVREVKNAPLKKLGMLQASLGKTQRQHFQ